MAGESIQKAALSGCAATTSECPVSSRVKAVTTRFAWSAVFALLIAVRLLSPWGSIRHHQATGERIAFGCDRE
jgi:hypothetical protein